jgi:hypothetical protein
MGEELPISKSIDLDKTIVFVGKPFNIFLSKSVGDFLSLIIILSGVGVLRYLVSLYSNKRISLMNFKFFTLGICYFVILWLLAYARKGRIKEIRQLNRFRFWGIVGGALIAIITLLEFLIS